MINTEVRQEFNDIRNEEVERLQIQEYERQNMQHEMDMRCLEGLVEGSYYKYENKPAFNMPVYVLAFIIGGIIFSIAILLF